MRRRRCAAGEGAAARHTAPPFLNLNASRKHPRLRAIRLPVIATIALLATLTASYASATCALIGDSIAQDLRGFFRECHANVKLGIGTKAIAGLVPAHADVIVVSAGSN